MNHKITIELEKRALTPLEALPAVERFLQQKEIPYEILSRDEIPLIAVKGVSYRLTLGSFLAGLVGLQTAILSPVDSE